MILLLANDASTICLSAIRVTANIVSAGCPHDDDTDESAEFDHASYRVFPAEDGEMGGEEEGEKVDEKEEKVEEDGEKGEEGLGRSWFPSPFAYSRVFTFGCCSRFASSL